MGFGLAQNPPIPGLPGVPGGGLLPPEEGDPVPQNLTQVLTTPDPDAIYPSGLEFPNVDGYGMASLYQSATGKRVLVSSAAKDAQFSFIQAGGLTNREVAQLVEKFLLMEGFQLNPDQRNPKYCELRGSTTTRWTCKHRGADQSFDRPCATGFGGWGGGLRDEVPVSQA